MARPLMGKVAIITGSSTGIGREIAIAFLQAGSQVVINSRSEERARSAAEELSCYGDTAPYGGDVAVEDTAFGLTRTATDNFGRLDILVNNAGISLIRPTEECSLGEWQRCLDVDLTGTFLCSREAGRHMLDHGGGSIINIASVASFGGYPNRAAYVAAKHGVLGLTETLAAEWAQYQIRVNAVAPAFVVSPMEVANAEIADYTDQDIIQRTPLGRKGTMAEIATAVLFLASDDASYVTGSTLRVDGGWLSYATWGNASRPPRPQVPAT